MTSKNWFIKVGDFFFKRRNLVFPLILVTLLLLFPPPSTYFGSEKIQNYKSICAVILIFAGLTFRAGTIGFAYIKRGGLNKEVYADKLVSSGFFGLCRNPLYVGNMAIYSGIFILHGHPVVIVAGIILYYIIYEMIIAAEEYFLNNKFGSDYTAYCTAIPRWRPKFSLYKSSVKNMSFSIKRVIAKDYTTIFNAILGMTLIECYKAYLHYPKETASEIFHAGELTIGILLLCVLFVKLMKKSGKFA